MTGHGGALAGQPMPDGMVTIMPDIATAFDISVFDDITVKPYDDSQTLRDENPNNGGLDQHSGRWQRDGTWCSSSGSDIVEEVTEQQHAAVSHRSSGSPPIPYEHFEFLVDPPSVPGPSSLLFSSSAEGISSNNYTRPLLSRLSSVGNHCKANGPVSAAAAPSLLQSGDSSFDLTADFLDSVREHRSANAGNKSILHQLLASRVVRAPQLAEACESTQHSPLREGMHCVGAMESELYRVDARAYAEVRQQQQQQQYIHRPRSSTTGTHVVGSNNSSAFPKMQSHSASQSGDDGIFPFQADASMINASGGRPTLALQTGLPSASNDLQSTSGSQMSSAMYSGLSNLDSSIPRQASTTSLGYPSASPRLVTPPEDAGKVDNSATVPMPGYATSPYAASSSTSGSGLQLAWQLNDNFVQSYGSDGSGSFLSASQPPSSWATNGYPAANLGYSAQPQTQPPYPETAVSQVNDTIHSVLAANQFPQKGMMPTGNSHQGYAGSWANSSPVQRPPLLQSHSGTSSLASTSSAPQMITTGGFSVPSSYIPQALNTPQASFSSASSHDINVLDQFQRMTMSGDWKEFVSSHVRGYLESPNRYMHGERKIVVHSPRVGQKSYGTEKRFLCPPPMATLIGRPWWTKDENGNPITPPAVNISISQEAPVGNAKAIWTTTHGRHLEEGPEMPLNLGEEPFVGRVGARTLHISEQSDKKRIVKALVKVSVMFQPGIDQFGHHVEPTNVVGVFESKEIKIISKPSKKRQTNKTTELCLQHGTPISLFNRLRSQTSSTKFLAVAPNITQIRGTDGKPLLGEHELPNQSGGFIADPHSWNSFLIWLVDPAKQPAGPPPPPVPVNDVYPPPVDAIDIPTGEPIPVIHYNNCIRLQCPSTGLLSPLFIIRRMDTASLAVGGDWIKGDGTAGKCPVGEESSDAVSQLHKVAFELYSDPYAPIYGRDMGYPGQWLTCEGDTIKLRVGKSRRTWFSPAQSPPPMRNSRQFSSSLPSTPSHQLTALLPMTPRIGLGNAAPLSPSAPVSPGGIMSPLSHGMPPSHGTGGDQSYFSLPRKYSGSSSGVGSSGSGTYTNPSTPWEDESTDGGPTRRRRGSSSASQGGFKSPMTATERHHNRKPSVEQMIGMGLNFGAMLPPTTMSTISGYEPGYAPVQPAVALSASGPGQSRQMNQAQHNPVTQVEFSKWTVEIAETATWTIVGTESKTYTFWVPPYVSALTKPITPFPTMVKYLPPGQAAEVGRAEKKYDHQFTILHNMQLATFYGSGFSKSADGTACHLIYYGSQPAEHHEVRCQEVMCAATPSFAMTPTSSDGSPTGRDVPISLVREDGQVVYPTSLKWRL